MQIHHNHAGKVPGKGPVTLQALNKQQLITPPLFPLASSHLSINITVAVSAIIFSQVSPSPTSPLTHPPTQAVGQASVLLPVLILVFPELGTESGRE